MCNLTCVALMLGLATPEPAQSKDHLAGLRTKLASPFSSDVTAGANGLAKLGADALPAVPDLAAALKKAKFDSERAALASALQKVVGDARATVPGLRADRPCWRCGFRRSSACATRRAWPADGCGCSCTCSPPTSARSR